MMGRLSGGPSAALRSSSLSQGPFKPNCLRETMDQRIVINSGAALTGFALLGCASAWAAEGDQVPFQLRMQGANWSLSESGLQVQRDEQPLALRLRRWGREQALRPAETGQLRSGASGRLELERPGLREYWQVRSTGMEQGFEVPAPPAGQGPLIFELLLQGWSDWEILPERRGALLWDGAGGLWRYDGLAAWDAQGRVLPAWMEATAQGLLLVADDSDARYPLTIDPELSPEALKLTASDGAAYAFFGCAVAGAGDVNGDGYADVLIGASGFSDYRVDMGAAYLYRGGPEGLALSGERRITASDRAGRDYFAGSVAGAGDLDGDGYDDLLVGSKGDDDMGSLSGSAYVYYGVAHGIAGHNALKLLASDGAEEDEYGFSVAGLGDVNGDGYDDLAVGAVSHDQPAIDAGSVYVYLGSDQGPDAASELRLYPSNGDEGDSFGHSVSAAGDVDGDGYDDVIVGGKGDDDLGESSGSAYVYSGGPEGVELASESKLLASDGDEFDLFGRPSSGAGDVNGDGYSDVILGAKDDEDLGAGSGSAYLFLGSAGGVDAASELKLWASDGREGDNFGVAVAAAGDVDADGYDDVLVGASWADDAGEDAGAAYVYFGCPNGLSIQRETKLWVSDGAAGAYLGGLVAGIGDVNGDGYDDLLLGAFGDGEQGESAGAAYVFHGTCEDGDEDGVCDLEDCDLEDPEVGDPTTSYLDGDGDGYGDLDQAREDCDGAPSGYSEQGGDCDDGDEQVNPGADERCDGLDNDCDEDVDEDDAVDAPTWYRDGDGDGYGTALDTTTACEQPSEFADNPDDCLDRDDQVYPGAPGWSEDCQPLEEEPDCGCAAGGRGLGGWGLLLLAWVGVVRRRSKPEFPMISA